MIFQISVKEEPLSEEDLRALQKDRQKKDNHNMSKQILHFPRHNLLNKWGSNTEHRPWWNKNFQLESSQVKFAG